MSNFTKASTLFAFSLCLSSTPVFAQTPVGHPFPKSSVWAETGLPDETQIVIDKHGRTSECRPPAGQTKTAEFKKLCDLWIKKQEKARAPIPVDSSKWINLGDYPAQARAAGEQGAVQIQLTIGVTGTVTGCEILKSSGFPNLDSGTCAILSRRARFRPRLDTEGRPAEARYIRNVNWKL